jgi:hypothetical protein
MAAPHIPILRHGQAYESLDKNEITSVRTGLPVAQVSQATAGMIRRDLRKSRPESLKMLSVDRLLAITCEAGRLFMEESLPLSNGELQSPQDYIGALSHTSGLPHNLIRRNMAKIHQVFTEMPAILRGLTRGLDMSVIDHGFGAQAGVPVSYFAATDSLAVVLPSNSPGVNSIWMPAIPLKIPVVLKPGREEPWTPYRIAQAFIAAGCPPDAFCFYPTDHEGSAAVMESCGRALIFGDQSTVDRYASNPAVEVHGPGWSKVLIGEDKIDQWPEYIDVLVDSVAQNGGRSCINASAVVVPRHGDAIAEALAERLAAIVPKSAADPSAALAGFANPKMAEFIDSALEEGLAAPGATDVTAAKRHSSRRAERDGSAYLLPTVVRCSSFDHPLANREFLFPYASVVEVPQDRMADSIGPSLVVTAITEDQSLIDSLLASTNIDRLNIGPIPTMQVQWDQPHEGNLFEFLYRRRAIQRV